MVYLYIKNDYKLAEEVSEFLLKHGCNYDLEYSADFQKDGWLITNCSGTAKEMNHVLYFGLESECPAGAVLVKSCEDLEQLIPDELILAGSSSGGFGIYQENGFPVDDSFDFDLSITDNILPVLDQLAAEAIDEDIARGALPEDFRESFISEDISEIKTIEMEQEEARLQAEEEARRKAEEEEVRLQAEEEARLQEEARRAEEEARRAEEEARLQEEARRAEEETRKKAEEEARKKAEELQPVEIVDAEIVSEESIEQSEPRGGLKGFGRRRVPQPAVSKVTPQPFGRSGRIHTRRENALVRRIYIVTGTSSGCGVSSFCYSLASALSTASTERTLLIDLDVLKPTLSKKLGALYDLDSDSDDTIDNFSTMPLDELLMNIEYLTSKISIVGAGKFSFIRGSSLSFKNRKMLCNMDYTETLDMISEVYQNVVVDIGVFNGMQAYQENLINNHYCTIVVLDCSTVESSRESIVVAGEIGDAYKAVLGKCDSRVNPFKIQNTIHRPILGKILTRASAAEIWRTGEPFGKIREPGFKEDWDLLVDEVKRM